MGVVAAVDPVTTVTSSADDATRGMDMMDDGPSLLLFAAVLTVTSIVAMVALPPMLQRLDLRRAVPTLALIGPILGVVGGIIGTGAMTLSGHDVWYALIVALAVGAAAIVVGLKLANPVARDLGRIGSTVEQVAHGDRTARTGIDRSDEIGRLAGAVDDLSRSLARAEAERAIADDERTAVVSALSHDLRTPLASLLASVDAIEDEIGDRESHLKAMRGNVLALEQLVEDLFLLARADSGSLELVVERLDVSELVDDAIDVVGPVADRRSVRLVAELGGPVLVDGDHSALSRVLRNLLDNAVRHSPPGGTVRIQADLSGTMVRLTVIDEGEGFDAEFVPLALQRFTQADDARSRPGAAGLGLAIANTLVEAHGGHVEIEPGPGARVSVALPAVERRRLMAATP